MSLVRMSMLAIVILDLTTTPAFAYLDPGTGSLILQGLIAAFFGGVLAIKTMGNHIKTFFLSLFKKSDSE